MAARVRGVVTLWHMIVMMSPFLPASAAVAVARVTGGGSLRYAVALAIGLGFAVVSVFGVTHLGKRGIAIAQPDGRRSERTLLLIYLGAAGWAFFAVPVVTVFSVRAALDLVIARGGQ